MNARPSRPPVLVFDQWTTGLSPVMNGTVGTGSREPGEMRDQLHVHVEEVTEGLVVRLPHLLDAERSGPEVGGKAFFDDGLDVSRLRVPAEVRAPCGAGAGVRGHFGRTRPDLLVDDSAVHGVEAVAAYEVQRRQGPDRGSGVWGLHAGDEQTDRREGSRFRLVPERGSAVPSARWASSARSRVS